MKAVYLCLVFLPWVAGCGSADVDDGDAGNGSSYPDIVAKSDHFDGYFDVYRSSKTPWYR